MQVDLHSSANEPKKSENVAARSDSDVAMAKRSFFDSLNFTLFYKMICGIHRCDDHLFAGRYAMRVNQPFR